VGPPRRAKQPTDIDLEIRGSLAKQGPAIALQMRVRHPVPLWDEMPTFVDANKMTLQASTVLSDHVDARKFASASLHSLEDVLACIILAIHTGALVSLPQKLAGGVFPGLGLIWAIGGVLCLIFASMDIKKTLQGAVRAWPVLLLTLWAWASFSWTVDTYETKRGAILITCSHLFAISLAARFTWERIIELIALSIVSMVSLSVLLALAMPNVGQMQEVHVGAWAGVWPEKQLLGIFACHGIVASLTMVTLGRKYAWWWIGVAICVLAVIGSTGKTALLMTFVAIAMGLWLRIYNGNVAWKAIAAWLGLIVGGLGILLVSGGLDTILGALGRSSDFTGRTEVWEAVKKLGDMRPHTGWGFQAVWRGVDVMTSPYQWIMDWTDFKPANAHSAWLDIYLQLGQPGFVLLALIMGWAWFGVLFRDAKNNVAIAFAGATLMAVTFISFTETNLAGAMDMQWFLVVLIGTKLYCNYVAPKQQVPAYATSGSLDGDTFTFGG
jgi:exopolysaccharide production protein ExoQ